MSVDLMDVLLENVKADCSVVVSVDSRDVLWGVSSVVVKVAPLGSWELWLVEDSAVSDNKNRIFRIKKESIFMLRKCK